MSTGFCIFSLNFLLKKKDEKFYRGMEGDAVLVRLFRLDNEEVMNILLETGFADKLDNLKLKKKND